MEKLRESLHEAPIIDKDGYSYLVHPLSNGVPMLEPELLREVVVGVTRAADLDVDKIVAPETMRVHVATALSLPTDIPLVVIRKRPTSRRRGPATSHRLRRIRRDSKTSRRATTAHRRRPALDRRNDGRHL